MSSSGNLRFILTALATVSLMIAVASMGYSQTVSGAIGGTISDTSGALVPGAKVTITNQDTGFQSETVSNKVGDYRIPFLPVGTYSVRVEAPGFRVFVHAGIILRVDDVLNIDAKLQVGTVSQQVTITGAVPLLDTDNANTGEVIEKDRIEDMPLNGRNFLQLTQLTADVNQGPKSGFSGDQFISPAQKGMDLSAEGERDTTTLFEIDGANARGGFLGTITLVPSLDTIQEFEIDTASFTARSGTSPVFVNIATKTGTNAFHGDLYEFDREAMLNAQNAFVTPANKSQSWHQHNFGGTIGGPVILPHYNGKDKTFFFASYEGNRERYHSPKNITVPLATIEQGNFGALCTGGFNSSGICTSGTQLYYPYTVGASATNPILGFTAPVPIPNNVITSTPATVGGTAIPNSAIQGYAKYIAPGWGAANVFSSSVTAGTWAAANPYIMGDNEFMARIDHHLRTNDQLYARWGDTNPRWDQPVSGIGNPNFEGLYTQAGQNLLVGETHGFGPRMFNEFRFSYNRSIEGCGPLYGVKNYASDFNWGGITETIGMPIISVSGYGALSDAPPGGYKQQTFQLSDNLSAHRGRHSITTGLDIFEFKNDMSNPGGFKAPYPRASVTFNGEYSKNAYADFLLGFPSAGSETINEAGYISPPMNFSYPDYNFYVQDDWKFSRRFTLNIGLRYEKAPILENPAMTSFNFNTGVYTQFGVKNQLYNSPNTDFVPRIGFAWQPFEGGKTVVRAGYGWYYGRSVMYGVSQLADNAPAVTNLALTVSTPLNGATAPTMATFLTGVTGSVSGGGWSIMPSFTPTPLTQIRSFDIQYQLPAGFLLDVGYKGSLTTHEDGVAEENTPPPGPGAIQQRRPYYNYPGDASLGSILTLLGVFNANYNAGIIRVEKRMGRGLSLLASYSYSKCLDQLGTPITQSEEGNGMGYAEDSYDLSIDKGLCGMDIRGRAVFSYIYQLPIGRGKHFLSSGGVLSKFIGDWVVSGITTFADGEPESVQDNFDIANTGESLERPDQYCNPNLPLAQRTTAVWFNSACFGNLNLDNPAVPSSYRYGTGGRSVIATPGVNDWDIALLKDVSVNERVRFQFRVESFNTMNHTPLNEPNGTMGGSTLSCVGEPCQGSFPMISTAGNPRQIQLGLKLYW